MLNDGDDWLNFFQIYSGRLVCGKTLELRSCITGCFAFTSDPLPDVASPLLSHLQDRGAVDRALAAGRFGIGNPGQRNGWLTIIARSTLG
jgi:hypothetical protein